MTRHLVERFAGGIWTVVGSCPDAITCVELYLSMIVHHPEWRLRRVTVHEETI